MYLDAATQLVRANIYLSTLPTRPLTHAELEGGLAGLNIATAKLQMLMDSKSAILVGAIAAHYTKINIKFLPDLQPIHALQADIDYKSNWLQRIQSEISRILSLQVAHNELGNNDQAHFERLQRSFESQQGLFVQVSDERNKLWKQLLPLQRKLSLAILEEVRTVQPMCIELLIAMRSDFEVISELDIFLRSAEKNMNEVIEELHSSLSRIDEQL